MIHWNVFYITNFYTDTYFTPQGKLCGFGVEEQLPTVAIVAHYDAYGIAPVSLILYYINFMKFSTKH